MELFMTRIIAVAIPKGGTGKTTTTINLGAALAERGQRVLLVDFDPSGALTQALGVQSDGQTVYSAISAYLSSYEPQLDSVIQTTDAGVAVVPADARLNLANGQLVAVQRGENVLRNLLLPIADHYDVILIDTLPYLGILVDNALTAAQEIIVPLQTEFLATLSVDLMIDHVAVLRRSDPTASLRITGILLTHADRTVMSRQVVAYTRDELTTGRSVDAPVFKTVIRRSVRFAEAQAMGKTILAYDPQGEPAQAYRALAQEVLDAAPH
jgi:chromosome partitioning protein